MRINQISQQYAQQLQMQMRQRPETRPVEERPDARLDAARQSNQRRVTDAGRGVDQATRVRDGVSAVDAGVKRARELVSKAGDTALSVADRRKLQDELGKTLAAIDQGAKDQAGALADKTLANKTYDTRRASPIAANTLGKGASEVYGSLADLKKIDLSTASTDQLAEAGKMLDRALQQSGAQLANAQGQVGRTSLRLDAMTAVQNTLEGRPVNADRQSQDLNAIQALMQQQNPQLPPGSLINTIV